MLQYWQTFVFPTASCSDATFHLGADNLECPSDSFSSHGKRVENDREEEGLETWKDRFLWDVVCNILSFFYHFFSCLRENKKGNRNCILNLDNIVTLWAKTKWGRHNSRLCCNWQTSSFQQPPVVMPLFTWAQTTWNALRIASPVTANA